MDEFLESAGEFGSYQKRMILLTGSVASLVSISTYASVFVTGEPQLVCKDQVNHSVNAFSEDEKCHMWSNMSQSSRFACEFDKKIYGDTIVTEFNLVCDRHYLASLTQTTLILGTIFSLFIGSIGDLYGRRKTTLVFLSLICLNLTVFEILVSTEYYRQDTRYLLYAIGQFLLGFTSACCYNISYILLLELTTVEFRTKITSTFSYSVVIGELVVMIAYYFSKNWQSLQWFMIIYSTGILIVVYAFLSESAQWLISVKRYEEAHELLKEMGRVNKSRATVEKQALMKLERNDDGCKNNNNTFKLLISLCQNGILLQTLLLLFIWNALNMVYYGISFGITSLNVINPYLMFFLSSLAEAVGAYIYQFNDLYGRRKTLIVFLSIASVSCLSVAAIQHSFSSSQVIVIFVLFGKAVTTGAFNIVYMFTSELYATSKRNTALQFLACFGSFGGFISPQINYLRVSVWQPLPYIIFSVAALVACACVSQLPETRNVSNVKPPLFRLRHRGIVCTC